MGGNYCLLPFAHCLLSIVYCQLPFAYCLLPVGSAFHKRSITAFHMQSAGSTRINNLVTHACLPG